MFSAFNIETVYPTLSRVGEYTELWLRKAGVGSAIIIVIWSLWFILKAALRDGKWIPYGLTGRLSAEGSASNWRVRVFWLIAAIAILSIAGCALYVIIALMSDVELYDPFDVSSSRSNSRNHRVADIVINFVCLLSILTVSIEFIFDVFRLSFRRVYAIARFTIKEAVRKKVLWIFLFLGIVVLFSSWFIKTEKKSDQWEQYINLVYYAISTMVLVTSAILACFSIPNDIKQQTIFTVVTKPVQTVELILGRFVGIAVLMTFILAISGCISLIYVARGVDPQVAKSIRARNVAFGDLLFLDYTPQGQPVLKTKGGDNIGRLWDYFQYLSGGTGQEAVWYFRNIDRSIAKKSRVHLEATFDIFRTSKGGTDKFEQGVSVQFYFVNNRKWKGNFDEYRSARDPNTNLPLSADEKARKYGYYELEKPARVFDEGEPTNISFPGSIMADSPPDASLEIHVNCRSSSQYLGTAQRNLYLLLDEGNWIANFFKGLTCTWMYMCLVVTISILFSTYLNAPISLLVVIIVLILGQPDIVKYLYEESLPDDPVNRPGGRAFEAGWRLLNKENMVTPLPDSAATRTTTALDGSIRYVFKLIHALLPELDIYDRKAFVAEGFDIPAYELLASIIKLLLYILPCLVIGYYFLNGRELAN